MLGAFSAAADREPRGGGGSHDTRPATARFGRHARPDRAITARSLPAHEERDACRPVRSGHWYVLPRKEVIQPQLPLRLPCYAFSPVTSPSFDGSLPCGLGHRLRVLLTPVV